MPSFIADGYTFNAGVMPINGVHDGIEFEYRNMTPAESMEYGHEERGASGEALSRIQAKWLQRKIVSWRARKNEDGTRDQIPGISESVLVAGNGGQVINSTLLTQIINVVLWGAAPEYTLEKYTEAEEVKNS